MSKGNDDEIVKIGLDGPRTAKQERERIATLRENAISSARNLVENEPDKYDADMLDTVIEELKGIPDDKLDGYLILGRQYKKLCRQVEFDQSEIQQVREMVTGIFPTRAKSSAKRMTVHAMTTCSDSETAVRYGSTRASRCLVTGACTISCAAAVLPPCPQKISTRSTICFNG